MSGVKRASGCWVERVGKGTDVILLAPQTFQGLLIIVDALDNLGVMQTWTGDYQDAVKSLSEARRLIVQGGVSINGEKISQTDFVLEAPEEALVKVGKRRYLKVLFK